MNDPIKMAHGTEQRVLKRNKTANKYCFQKAFTILRHRKKNAKGHYPQISSYYRKNGCYEENRELYRPVRMRGEGSPYSLLMGMETGEALWTALCRFPKGYKQNCCVM